MKKAPIGSLSLQHGASSHFFWCRFGITLRWAHRRGFGSSAYDLLRRSISTAGMPDRNSSHVEASGMLDT